MSWNISSIFVFVLFLIKTIHAEQNVENNLLQRYKKAEALCLQKPDSNITAEELSTVKDLVIGNYNQQQNCFVHCIFQEFGLYENNKVNKTAFKNLLTEVVQQYGNDPNTEEDRIFQTAGRCISTEVEIGCDASGRFLTCIADNIFFDDLLREGPRMARFAYTQRRCRRKHAELISRTEIDAAQIYNYYDQQNQKCYLACYFEETGLVDSDGKANFTSLDELLYYNKNYHKRMEVTPDEDVGPILRNCMKEFAGGDKCNATKLFTDCLHADSPTNHDRLTGMKKVCEFKYQTKMDEDRITDIVLNNSTGSKNETCILSCIIEKAKLIDSNNLITTEVLKNYIKHASKYYEYTDFKDLYSVIKGHVKIDDVTDFLTAMNLCSMKYNKGDECERGLELCKCFVRAFKTTYLKK